MGCKRNDLLRFHSCIFYGSFQTLAQAAIATSKRGLSLWSFSPAALNMDLHFWSPEVSFCRLFPLTNRSSLLAQLHRLTVGSCFRWITWLLKSLCKILGISWGRFQKRWLLFRCCFPYDFGSVSRGISKWIMSPSISMPLLNAHCLQNKAQGFIRAYFLWSFFLPP